MTEGKTKCAHRNVEEHRNSEGDRFFVCVCGELVELQLARPLEWPLRGSR